MSKIVIPYSPRPEQKLIHAGVRKHRFSTVVTHRRLGKTVCAVVHLIMAAMENKLKLPRYSYAAPTYKMAKNIAWQYLKQYARPIPDTYFNESELKCTLPNDAIIQLVGVDNPDALRGVYNDGVVCDEYGMFPVSAFAEVIRPTLVDRAGWCLFMGTPNGINQFYEEAEKSRNDPRRFHIEFPVTQTNIIPPEELELLKHDMSEEEYAQEFLVDFSSSARGAYFGQQLRKAREEDRIRNVPHDPSLPTFAAIDLGFSDSTAIWFWQQVAQEVRFIDYYESSGESLEHYIRYIRELPYIYREVFAPHDIKVHELTTGRSRLDVAAELGLRFSVLPKHSIDERIHAARTLLPRTWFDQKNCAKGLEALHNYRRQRNERTGEWMDKPQKDWSTHGADAFGYACVATDMVNPSNALPRVYSTLTQEHTSYR